MVAYLSGRVEMIAVDVKCTGLGGSAGVGYNSNGIRYNNAVALATEGDRHWIGGVEVERAEVIPSAAILLLIHRNHSGCAACGVGGYCVGGISCVSGLRYPACIHLECWVAVGVLV